MHPPGFAWTKGSVVKIRVLGCHGSDLLLDRNGRAMQCRPCAFLINDTVLLDAGTVGSRLTLPEQMKISHVLLSHLHFDHIKDLPTLADNLVCESGASLVVASIPEVLDGLRTHIFNSSVYPDFFRLPEATRPVFISQNLQVDCEWTACGLRIVPIRVNHVVPTVGFLISDERTTILYSADTYQTEDLWRAASCMPNLNAAFIEVSYPNAQASFAQTAKHLTPELMGGEFRKIGRDELPVYVYHVKPRFRSAIEAELRQLPSPQMTVLEEDLEVIF
jgi:ribonuclease BN (tRNA processing enzyme)